MKFLFVAVSDNHHIVIRINAMVSARVIQRARLL